VGAFAAAGLFHHHRYQRCTAILWFFEIFHWVNVAGTGPECFTLHPSPHSLPQRFCFWHSAPANRVSCRCAAWLSSYRPVLALSNEREALPLIRYCVPPCVRVHV